MGLFEVGSVSSFNWTCGQRIMSGQADVLEPQGEERDMGQLIEKQLFFRDFASKALSRSDGNELKK